MELHFNMDGRNRKTIVEAISKTLGVKAEYLSCPTFAYRIGDYEVAKDGTVTGGGDIAWDGAVADAIVMAGFEPLEWEENEVEEELEEVIETTNLSISMPDTRYPAEVMENFKRLVESKSELLKLALKTESLEIIREDKKVTFPWFSELSEDSAYAYMQLIIKMTEMATNQKRINAKQKEVVNPKYEFRCFLLRLGFIGDEYKGVRKELLKNLEGSSAFKSGTKKGGE